MAASFKGTNDFTVLHLVLLDFM